MTVAGYAAFAGALAVLFITPGPGILAMVARTLDAGPRQGAVFGAGIITGDIFLFTLAVTGLAALEGRLGPLTILAKAVGAGFLLWMAWRAFRSALSARPPPTRLETPTRLGLTGTYVAGAATPLSNPKPLAFYLTLLPAFFDLSAIDPAAYGVMVAIMLALFAVTTALYVGAAHWARDWLRARAVRRWSDLLVGTVLIGVAILLLLR